MNAHAAVRDSHADAAAAKLNHSILIRMRSVTSSNVAVPPSEVRDFFQHIRDDISQMDEPSKVEITLTQEDAEVAGRLLSQLVGTGAKDRPADFPLVELASRIRRARHERRHYFSDELFGDPGWDMILSLYCADARGERLSVTALGHSVGLPQTTAVRWINSLSEAGLIERERDEHDRRRSFLRLTAATQEKVTHWLARTATFLGLLSSSAPEGR